MALVTVPCNSALTCIFSCPASHRSALLCSALHLPEHAIILQHRFALAFKSRLVLVLPNHCQHWMQVSTNKYKHRYNKYSTSKYETGIFCLLGVGAGVPYYISAYTIQYFRNTNHVFCLLSSFALSIWPGYLHSICSISFELTGNTINYNNEQPQFLHFRYTV